ncbi:MAG TPA: hypothetical protein V6D15_09390 [Oculatellaceae cyanobacterium]
MNTQLTFWLPGKCSPKVRPRASVINQSHSATIKKTKAHVYNCPRYKAWKNWAICSLYRQFLNQNKSNHQIPLEHIEILIVFVGKHRGDGENMVGAVLDSAVQANIITDDCLKNIPTGCWEHRCASNPKITGTLVLINPINPTLKKLNPVWEKWILSQTEEPPTLPKSSSRPKNNRQVS